MMKRWLPVGAAIVAGLAGAIVAGVAVGGVLWDAETARRVARLQERRDAAAPPFSPGDLAGLPEPVLRYFEFALTPGQPVVRTARFDQIGQFAMRAGSWSPFTAVEYFSVTPPGFLWDARIRAAAKMSVCVRDGYAAGEGAMYGALAALVPVVNVRGTPAMASGELLRYLVEAALFPTALLPRDGVSWEPIGDNAARVTLTDRQTTVSCDVTFNERGEIVESSAMRYRDANGKSELTPWVGRWGDYRRVAGMMIPTSAEVEWVMPEGPQPYWRGRIVSALYAFAL